MLRIAYAGQQKRTAAYKMEDLIDSKALAQKLGLSVATVQRYTARRTIPHIMIGSLTRYRLSDVLKALEAK